MLKVKVPKYAQRKVLTPKELKNLLRVKTTEAQAVKIIERNLAVLRGLKRGRYATLPYGCPHCNVDYDCEDCAWTKAFPEASTYDFKRCIDPQVTFGGGAYRQIMHVFSYGHAIVTIKKGCRRSKDLGRARVYALGHIQWALAVIAKAKKRGKHGKAA